MPEDGCCLRPSNIRYQLLSNFEHESGFDTVFAASIMDHMKPHKGCKMCLAEEYSLGHSPGRASRSPTAAAVICKLKKVTLNL